MAMDEEFLLIFDKRMVRVLVKMDLSQSLPTKIELKCNDFTFYQQLNYLHVPFCCNKCHAMGHLKRSFPLLLHGSGSWTFLDVLRSPSSGNGSPKGPTIPPFGGQYSPHMGMYDSLSPSVFDDISKGQLLFIQDVEACASLLKVSGEAPTVPL